MTLEESVLTLVETAVNKGSTWATGGKNPPPPYAHFVGMLQLSLDAALPERTSHCSLENLLLTALPAVAARKYTQTHGSLGNSIEVTKLISCKGKCGRYRSAYVSFSLFFVKVLQLFGSFSFLFAFSLITDSSRLFGISSSTYLAPFKQSQIPDLSPPLFGNTVVWIFWAAQAAASTAGGRQMLQPCRSVGHLSQTYVSGCWG